MLEKIWISLCLINFYGLKGVSFFKTQLFIILDEDFNPENEKDEDVAEE